MNGCWPVNGWGKGTPKRRWRKESEREGFQDAQPRRLDPRQRILDPTTEGEIPIDLVAES